METSTYKTSTIFVSTGRRTRVFRSMQEVPVRLRDKLNANISGPNSRTLIVADRRGREYLVQSLKRAASVDTNTSATGRRLPRTPAAKGRWTIMTNHWLEIGLIGLLGIASWTLFAWK